MNIREVQPQNADSPERRKQLQPGQEEKFKKLTQIEKVKEIDADENRKRKKQRGEPEEEASSMQKFSSPMEIAREKTPKTDLFRKNFSAKQGFGSPVASTTPSPSFSSESEPTEGLPSSNLFWQGAPLNAPEKKSERSLKKPSEKSKELPSKKSSKEEKVEPFFEKEEISPTPVDPKKASSNTKEVKESVSSQEKEEKPFEKKPHIPANKTSSLEEKRKDPSFSTEKKPLRRKKKKEINEPITPKKEAPSLKEKKKGRKTSSKTPLKHIADNFAPMLVLPSENKETSFHKEGKKKETHPIAGLDSIKIPPEIAAEGLSATTSLPSYISPQVQNLFAQMVSTILVMQTKEIVSTQVELNTPSFEKSIFKGAIITIDRYSTAPGSFNIRLSGSPEAVQLFEKNISTLQAAFQKGKFSFRVSRLETSLKEGRPLVQRKGSSKETGGGS